MNDEHVSRTLTEIHAWAREHAKELRSRNGVRLRMKLSKRAIEPECRFRVWLYNHRKRIEATPQLAAQLSAIAALIADAPSNPDAPLQPGVSVSFPGITIRWPFSQLILAGAKTIEVRRYMLGHRNIAVAGQEYWLVETPGVPRGAIERQAVLGDVDVAPRPEIVQIVGTVVFVCSYLYRSEAKFRADEVKHWIHEGSVYDWRGKCTRYAWRVSSVRRLAHPVPQPGPSGITGFGKPRTLTVHFTKDSQANQVGLSDAPCSSISFPVGTAIPGQLEHPMNDSYTSGALVESDGASGGARAN